MGTIRGVQPAWVVVLGGVSAALHVGKMPPAIPVLQEQLGVTLVQAGFLLSLVALAGMVLGMVSGLVADGFGPRRSMVTGLALLTVAGFAGGWARDPTSLLVLRAVEGMGFLLSTVPAPGLLRRLLPADRLTTMLGFWSAYMPLGTALALLLGPLAIGAFGWPWWWWLTAGFSALMALAVLAQVPADSLSEMPTVSSAAPWRTRLVQTVSDVGPWLGALSFAVYSAQWLAVIGFLPALYAQAGWGGAQVAVLTAVVAAVNIVGNIGGGYFLGRGWAPRTLLWTGFGCMAAGTFLAFSALTADLAVPRYFGALLFSTFGGLVPGTLFGLAPRLAPTEHTISTTVGWLQQWSSIGQVAGPPFVAWVASRFGGWQWTWLVTGGCCLAGAALAYRIGVLVQRKPAASS